MMSLLFLLAATILIVLCQLPQILLVLFWFVALLVRGWQRQVAGNEVQLDDGKVSLVRGEQVYPATLGYHNDWWMVVSLVPLPQATMLQRVVFFVAQKHQVLYRDHFSCDDYRLVRSTLSVAKFIAQSASPKNES